LIGLHFFEIDIGTTRPADISTPATALVPAVRYALVLAGLSKLAQTMGKTSLPVLSLNDASSVILFHKLAADIARGLFDGVGADGALTLGNCAGMCALRSATVRTDLASALIAFLGSPEDNKSGQGYDQVIGRITALTTNKEPELFPPDDGDPDPIDVLPPVITWWRRDTTNRFGNHRARGLRAGRDAGGERDRHRRRRSGSSRQQLRCRQVSGRADDQGWPTVRSY
jgi:hypothetical protein